MNSCDQCKIWKRYATALQKLLMAYRLNQQPSEKTFTELDFCKSKLNIT